MSENEPFHNPEFEQACALIEAAWHDDFGRDGAIQVLETAGVASGLRGAIADMTAEEWEDFVLNYLGEA